MSIVRVECLRESDVCVCVRERERVHVCMHVYTCVCMRDMSSYIHTYMHVHAYARMSNTYIHTIIQTPTRMAGMKVCIVALAS